MSHAAQTGYRGILKSTVLVGAGAGIGLALGMVRGKFIAVQLHAGGIGLYGLLSTLLPFLTTLLSFGLAQSGVKAVAADEAGRPRGAASVYWLTPRLAVLATVVTAIGMVLFGRTRFLREATQTDLYWLSLGVGASVLAAGWGSILQGRQALRQLMVASVVAGVVTTVLAVPCIWWWRKAGIVAVIVIGSAAAAAANWWALHRENHPGRELPSDPAALRAMLRLGLLLAGGLIVAQGSGFLTRWLVTAGSGLSSGGWYQAAITVAATLPNFALNAMGASLYPQLVLAPDRRSARDLVNRQLQMALLLTGPVLLAVSTLAPLLLQLMFAKGFDPAIELVRWMVLGTFGRLVSWPVGYLLLARSAGRVFLVTEALAAVLLIVFTGVGVKLLGIKGAGVALAAAYGVYCVLVLVLGWRLHEFRLDRLSLRWIGGLGAALGLVQLGFARLPPGTALALGLTMTTGLSVTAAIRLWRLTRGRAVPEP